MNLSPASDLPRLRSQIEDCHSSGQRELKGPSQSRRPLTVTSPGWQLATKIRFAAYWSLACNRFWSSLVNAT